MRIDVVGKHLEITAPIKQYAEGKAARLVKHYDGLQLVTIRCEQEPHNKGFHVEVVADAEKHADFVAHDKGEDLYACIDKAVDKAARQLTDFKEKLKQSKRGSTPASGN
ncbi:MAG: ribosome-associated translation inhibitor RaiA [Phycisphaerales bacterium]|nr:ribosome-associated translation inhibitor RaiA [Phycisphaerales bacterium]